MPENQSLVALMPWTSIFVLCNLFILTWGVKRFLFKPVQAVFAKRKAELAESYAQAQQAEETATALRTEYESRLASAKEEATSIVKSATERATARGEEIVNNARADAAAVKTKADADIENARKLAANALKDDISGMALEIAGKVVGKEIDATAHKTLIDEFIAGVGDAS